MTTKHVLRAIQSNDDVRNDSAMLIEDTDPSSRGSSFQVIASSLPIELARLLAAAPDLLAALEFIVTNSGFGGVNKVHSADLERACAAIAKAKGQ